MYKFNVLLDIHYTGFIIGSKGEIMTKKRKKEYRTNPDTDKKEMRYEGDRLWVEIKSDE